MQNIKDDIDVSEDMMMPAQTKVSFMEFCSFGVTVFDYYRDSRSRTCIIILGAVLLKTTNHVTTMTMVCSKIDFLYN